MAKGKETKRRIVAEAAAIFNQHGYEGGSMSALMEATGLEKGGIYRHFCSKEELAAQAFDYAWHAAVETRVRDLDLIPNSVDRLKAFITNFAERRSPIPGGCPLLNTAIEADDGNPVLRERARKALAGWRNRLVTIIQEGLAKREMKSSVDAKKLANLIISSLEGALMISRLEKSSKALADIGSHLKAYLDAEVRTRRK